MAEGEGAESGERGVGTERALTRDFVVHEAGFEGGEADAVEMGGAQGVGGVGGEGRESEFARVETVAARVAGGVELAAVGDGSAGFGAVDTGGKALEFGAHGGCLWRLHYGPEAGGWRVRFGVSGRVLCVLREGGQL